ncbi:MAG: sulfite exporter TauE/SafE family protein [Chloroflexota bacterium]
MENTLAFYLMTAFVGLLIGVAKGGLGGLMGALATPLMALVMPPQAVVGLLLPMLIFADAFALAGYWKRWNVRLVLLMLPGAVLGVTAGTYFIKSAPTALLRNVLAAIVLLFTLYKLLEARILQALPYRSRPWHGVASGTLAGFSSALAHAGGPPVAIYLLMQKLPPLEFTATTVLFFTIVNWIKVPYYAYVGLFDFPRLVQVFWLLPVIPLGVWIGRQVVGRIDRLWFERVIVAALFATAVMLILE